MNHTDFVNPFGQADQLFANPLAKEMLGGYAPALASEGDLSLSGRMPWDEEDAPSISPAKPVLPPEKKVRSLRVISSEEIARAQYTRPPFVVEGLLPAGLTIFAAPPKTGKSWLCLELACCVATGAPFWGRKTCAGTVLYLDLESRDYRVQSRMEKTGLAAPAALGFVFEAERLDTGLIPQLSEHLAAHPDLRLVIVDTLARVKGAGRQKSDAYITDTMILAPLQSWALNNGVAVICVTHMRKQGVVRADSDPFEQITGSNAQFGVADGAWLITGTREGREQRFIASGRDYEGADMAIAFSQDTCRWQCLGDTQDQRREAYAASPVVKTIRALLRESGGTPVRVTANDLLTAIIQRQGMVGYTAVTLSKYLRSISPLLYAIDNIRFTPSCSGGKLGRYHEFSYDIDADPTNVQITVPTVPTVHHPQ